ncbi:MAG: nucleotidyltransferase domain-containing protein, partial [Chloroflexota bacterium]|nr:nucleotidyltransferase domain-containing protein [Chloroflexota bacterium]
MKRSVQRIVERKAEYHASPSRRKLPERFGFEPVTSHKIRAVVRKIVENFDPEKVILFGSYAYGKPSIHSDVDVLIVMESTERPAVRAARVYKAVQGKTFPMDILVRTPQELQHRLKMDDF